MAKTQKELAFLRELSVDEDWTRRFTDLIDKHFDLSESENLLYLNAGNGTHAMALGERFEDKIDIFATCENEDLLHIARDKAAAIKSKVDFSTIRFEDEAFDSVISDASLVRPEGYEAVLDDATRTAKIGAKIGVLTVSAGSFGEIFSLLWEVLFSEDLGEHGHVVEELIAELPTVSEIEQLAQRSGLVNVHTHVGSEVFEYENGAAFVSSPLVEDFLLPVWLESFSEDEKERVTKGLSDLIDKEDGNLSFRFSVKASLVTGEKG